jgi:hypothetical protein
MQHCSFFGFYETILVTKVCNVATYYWAACLLVVCRDGYFVTVQPDMLKRSIPGKELLGIDLG